MILHNIHKTIKKAWGQLNGDKLSKEDIKNIKELVSNRKGKTKNDNHQNEE